MIERYLVNEINDIWKDKNRFDTYLMIEIKVLEAWNKLNIVPTSDLLKIKKNASFDLNQIYEIEKETKHDVIAFTKSISNSLGVEKKWIHYGLTSTDVVDTANGFMLKQANNIIRSYLLKFIDVLKKRAYEFKDVPIIGRTHGIHADITSFGLKWALWYDEMSRDLERFDRAREEVEIGKISGAVGNFVNTPPFVQDYVCKVLNINSSKISTQVLQRDRHANYVFTLSLIASSIEKIALEIRSLQRTEIREVQEYFDVNQKGSSAMPHKRNPISSENITGISRIIKSYVMPTLDNIQLWHERDISHSSVERIILPDATNLITYMLKRYTDVLENLIVYPKRMLENINLTNGIVFSQRILTEILNSTNESREVVYDWIQSLAFKAWNENLSFYSLLQQESNSKFLKNLNLDELFDINYFLKQTDEIFKRVFK